MKDRFVLDANAFIQAKRRFYPFDIAPGYWTSLIWHRSKDLVLSIDRVRDEIARGEDDLWEWVERDYGVDQFDRTDTPQVLGAYGEIIGWAVSQPQFTQAAKDEFAREDEADAWLVAYARASQVIVVTLEEYHPDVKRRILLPNVCEAFGVKWITPFEMLRRLGVRLEWEPPL